MRTYRGPVHGLVVMARSDGLRSLQAGLAPAMMYQVMPALIGRMTNMGSHWSVCDERPPTGDIRPDGAGGLGAGLSGPVQRPQVTSRPDPETESSSLPCLQVRRLQLTCWHRWGALRVPDLPGQDPSADLVILQHRRGSPASTLRGEGGLQRCVQGGWGQGAVAGRHCLPAQDM